jgi:hypothetical protein
MECSGCVVFSFRPVLGTTWYCVTFVDNSPYVNVPNKNEDVIFSSRDGCSRFLQMSASIVTSHKKVILKRTDASGTGVLSWYSLAYEDPGPGALCK